MKKSLRSVLCLVAICYSTLASCQQAAVIDQAEVTRIITTLASDEMEGRMIYTPGIEKASAFIESEFEKIGLEYLDGLNSYKQQFNMYSLSSESASVTINGESIAADKVVGMISSASMTINAVADANIVVVGAADNMQAKFGEARGKEGKTIMLVNTAHEALFGRFKQFFSRPSSVMELDDTNGMVIALTDLSEVKSLSVEVKNNIETKSLNNVAGQITGNRPNEIVLFSAHYDHLGIRGDGEDKIYNGANDDASGTTAVMTLAKYFKDTGKKPERTIMFVAFTAEESGGFGSRHFSQKLNPDEIVAMFNIEMIGTAAKEGTNSAWITGFDKSSFGALLQKAVEGTGYKFYADPYVKENLFYRSDNATLARLGVPAHSISTTQIDVDPYYHQASDEVSTIDLDHMTNTIRALAAAAVRMISGEDTPTRVDPANVR
ncbi:M28 family metallopeptidase [Roseivirga sp. E12]|uniref:M28 family metallopeptidase n=1 Tax=Roseivirga sp. E12 TaxID=2819237 RepID=UPI001ABD2D6A|nr:M20/M25/M40 family metallo-hydrolase [Roseivirga sp. E12]MBO3697699.1 M20/M25/M40 family metallo-hydrolase [Roseivirga sp. E12]